LIPHLEYRNAVPDDAADCIEIRGKTRENAVSIERLRCLGITVETWAEDIRTGALPGHVCLAEGKIVGYCFGSSQDGEIVVLALLPDCEGHGIGRELLSKVIIDLVALGKTRLFLGCSSDPSCRSYGFYRHLGWRSTGQIDKYGDDLLEFDIQGEHRA
jgi:ribosomal protein S18 acetylase RimI-like enzyme